MASASETEEYVSPYNDAEIMAGQGTLGVEIMDQLPNIDYLFIAVGGGASSLEWPHTSRMSSRRSSLLVVNLQPLPSCTKYGGYHMQS